MPEDKRRWPVGQCPVCLGWGQMRQYTCCAACSKWRRAFPGQAACLRCSRVSHVSRDGLCRPCLLIVRTEDPRLLDTGPGAGKAAPARVPPARSEPGPGASVAGAGATQFVPLIDGRRNEVFAAVYRRAESTGGVGPLAGADLELVVGLTVVGAADLPQFLGRSPGAIVGGDGAALHAGLLPATVVLAAGVAGPAAGPSALMVARTFLAGSPAIRRGFDETLPIYGREPDAVPRAANVSSPPSVSPSSRRSSP